MKSITKLFFPVLKDNHYILDVLLNISAEAFKPFDNRIQFGTCLKTPKGNCMVIGCHEKQLWVKYDNQENITFHGAQCLQDLEKMGVVILPTPFDEFQLISRFNGYFNMKMDVGTAAFKAFENQIQLGTRLITPYKSSADKDRYLIAIVLGCSKKKSDCHLQDGRLCLQIEGQWGIHPDYYPPIYNLQQLLEQGFEILPSRLEQIVRKTIVKNQLSIMNAIDDFNRPLPENFFNRLQTVFKQNNLMQEAPFVFFAIKTQAKLEQMNNEVNEVKTSLQQMQEMQKLILEQNRQLIEKLNVPEQNSHNQFRRRTYSS